MGGILGVVMSLLIGCGSSSVGDGPILPFLEVEESLYGFINNDGETFLTPQFAYALPYSEGLAAVNVGGTGKPEDFPTDGKWGFINLGGKFTINPQYDSPPVSSQSYDTRSISLSMHQGYEFSEGLAAVYLSGKQWVYIDSLGRPVIQGKNIQSARKFTSNGLAAVYVDNKWGYINKKGQMVIPPQFQLPVDFEEDFALVLDQNYNLICIDRTGKPRFEWLRFTQGFHNGYAVAKAKLRGENNTLKNEFQHILVNQYGNNTLKTAPFEALGKMGDGLIPALVGSKPEEMVEYPRQVTLTESQGGKWGFIDTSGTFVINPLYAEAKGFSQGLAAVKLTEDSDWGFINTNGNWVVEPGFRRVGQFKNGLCQVTLGLAYNQYFDKKAYLNPYGRIVFIQP